MWNWNQNSLWIFTKSANSFRVSIGAGVKWTVKTAFKPLRYEMMRILVMKMANPIKIRLNLPFGTYFPWTSFVSLPEMYAMIKAIHISRSNGFSKSSWSDRTHSVMLLMYRLCFARFVICHAALFTNLVSCFLNAKSSCRIFQVIV